MVLEEGEEEEEAEEEVVEAEEEEAAIRTMTKDSQIAKMKAIPIPLDLAQIQTMVLINQTATLANHVIIQVSTSQI